MVQFPRIWQFGGGQQPAEKSRSRSAQRWGALIAAVGHPIRAKGQYRATREGFVTAEEAKLTWKRDEVGT